MGCLVTAPHTALTDLWQWEVASIPLSGGEGPDPLTRPSLTISLWGGGEVSHYHWVGVGLLPDTGRWGGRGFPTRPLGCDPSGVEEVLGCLLTTRKRGSPQSLLILCWHRWGYGHSFYYGSCWNRAVIIWNVSVFLAFSLLFFGGLFVWAWWCFWVASFSSLGHMRQNKAQEHIAVLFSVPRSLASLSSLYLSELYCVCFICDHQDMYVFLAGGIRTIMPTPCFWKWSFLPWLPLRFILTSALKQFDFDILWCNFLRVSCTWGSLSFLDLWVYSFHQNKNFFQLLFL